MLEALAIANYGRSLLATSKSLNDYSLSTWVIKGHEKLTVRIYIRDTLDVASAEMHP